MASISWFNMQAVFWARAAAAAAAVCVGSSASASPGSARRAAEKTPLNRPRSSPEQQYFTELDRADALVNTDTRGLLYISTSLS